MSHLRTGEALILEHDLFQRRQGIAHIGDAHVQGAAVIVDGAALLDGLAASDAVVDQQGDEGVGDALLRHHVDEVVVDDMHADVIGQLILEGGVYLVIGSEGSQVAHAFMQADACGGVCAVVEGQLHDLAEVDEGGTVGAGALLTLDDSLRAADDGVFDGVLPGNAAVDQGGDIRFIAVIGRLAAAQFVDIQQGVHIAVAGAVVIAGGDGGVLQFYHSLTAQDQIGQVVGAVHAVFVLPAHSDIGGGDIAQEGTGIAPGGDLAQLVEFYIEAAQQLGDIVIVKALLAGLPVVGVQGLIETAEGDRLAVILDLQHGVDEIHTLDGLVDISGGLGGDAAAHRRDLFQLGPADGIRLGSGQLLRQRRIARGKGASCLAADDGGTEEVHLAHILRLGQIQRIQALLGTGGKAVQAFPQHTAQVHNHVAFAADHQELCADDTVLIGRPGVAGHAGLDAVMVGLSLPVGRDLTELFLVRLGDDIAVSGALFKANGVSVQFVDDPLDIELRIDLGAAEAVAHLADDQLAVPNGDGQVLHGVLHGLGAANGDGLGLCLAVALRDQDGAVRCDLRNGVHDGGTQRIHTGAAEDRFALEDRTSGDHTFFPAFSIAQHQFQPPFLLVFSCRLALPLAA